MATLIDRPVPPPGTAVPAVPGAASWPLRATVLGTSAVVIGLLWDISWHASIGRDTFWTPAHLAIYLGGLLCGLSAGWLALSITFGGTAAQRTATVGFWGFRAPLGAWAAIWGCIAMVASAPFDNWWHDAYGLDVKIISPPHLLLAAGILATQLGAMLQALAAQNRDPWLAGGGAGAGTAAAWIYAYTGGLLLALVSTMFLEYNEANRQHGALFYEIACAAYPVVLVGVARGSHLRWPATTVAGVFMAVRLAMTWVLPLFPATPRLAPIFNPVRHLWPPTFPELLIVPAIALDRLLHSASRPDGALAAAPDGRRGGRTLLALRMGTVFFALLLAVQWTFSELLLTPYARNWFFGADQWTYRAHPGDWRYRYWLENDAFGWRGAALALLLATLSARLGLAWGGWLSRVRR